MIETRKLGAFLDNPGAATATPRRHIPHHPPFQRHNLNFANQLLAHVKAADESGWAPPISFEVLKQIFPKSGY